MEEFMDVTEVERAKTFWSEEDVDQVFDRFLAYLEHLRSVLKKNCASDKEFVLAFRLLESLDCSSPDSPQNPDQELDQDLQDKDQNQDILHQDLQDEDQNNEVLDQDLQDPEEEEEEDSEEQLQNSVVQVMIGSDESLRPCPPSVCASPASLPLVPPVMEEELLPPLMESQLHYQQHGCGQSCLPGLPIIPRGVPPFWALNPLKVPLICGFKRLRGGGAWRGGGESENDVDIVYKAPCGQSLCNHDDVMRFLLVTESFHILQVDFFSFNPSVCCDPPVAPGPRLPEQDLSRGVEPTPVEVCIGEGGARPAEFRYRKERWPHGCFLSRGPALFDACCDCDDGCTDPDRCACVAMTTGGRYTHQRLQKPIPSGLYECGPWCGCHRSLCGNRVVQRGLRVRLQVFQTSAAGWGVRCRDDLDQGTFVCVYAGVVLRRLVSPSELPPPKLTRSDLPSDDDVEVVTEWLAPPILDGRGQKTNTPPPASPSLQVPVIQRPLEVGARTQNQAVACGDVETVLIGGLKASTPTAGVAPPTLEQKVATTMVKTNSVNGTKSLKRTKKADDVCYIDASREGNVSRFINHSCQPNLFIQNVFTDSHDAAFPHIAFFTNRALSAGTELTWDYNSDTNTYMTHTQEVMCVCGSDGCRGQFTIEERLCDASEVDGYVTTS